MVKEIFELAFKKKVPQQLVIQMTDRCNASCPQCGMRRGERFKRSTLEADELRRVIDAAAERGVQSLSFTGGEPLLFLDTLCDLIDYAGAAGIRYIRTGTNGYLFRKRVNDDDFNYRVNTVAEKLAYTSLRNFWISIDSAHPEIHESMRGFDGLIDGIRTALPIFHAHGLYPSANLGINRNLDGEKTRDAVLRRDGEAVFTDRFRKGFQRFYDHVIDLGFTIVNACYPMSIDAVCEDADDLQAVYAASAADDIVSFSPAEKVLIFKALLETVPEYRDRIRIFSPRASLHALVNQYSQGESMAYPCRGGIDFFFIDARDGNTYPCGYRGNDNFGKFWDIDWERVPRQASCRKCDWECFRDPSELFGPFLDLFRAPGSLIKRLIHDPGFFSLWVSDLRYYSACSLFDGRSCPRPRKLRPYAARHRQAESDSLKREETYRYVGEY